MIEIDTTSFNTREDKNTVNKGTVRMQKHPKVGGWTARRKLLQLLRTVVIRTGRG